MELPGLERIVMSDPMATSTIAGSAAVLHGVYARDRTRRRL